jgi:MFS family permease
MRSTSPTGRDAFAVFRIRDFRLLIGGSFITTILQQTQAVALGWDIYERTGSAMALALMGIVQFVPVILLFLPAGQLADRYDRRWIMVLSQLLWCAGSIELALAAWLGASVNWMYLGLAASGMAMVINRPSRDALLPQVVPLSLLARAVSWNSSAFQIASVTGPALAGLLLAISGAVQVYMLNGVLAIVALGLTVSIHARPVATAQRDMSWSEMFAGLAHVWQTKVILGLMAIDLFVIVVGGVSALLPIYAKDILGVGPTGLGWLSAAPALGAIAMAVLQAYRQPWQHGGRSFIAAMTGFSVAMLVFGLSPWFWLSFAALLVGGACDFVGAIIRQTVLQLRTPDALRGRVSAVNRVFISSSNELGAFRAGALTSIGSPVLTVMIGGVATLAFIAAGTRLFPSLRRLGRLE